MLSHKMFDQKNLYKKVPVRALEKFSGNLLRDFFPFSQCFEAPKKSHIGETVKTHSPRSPRTKIKFETGK